MTLDFGLWTLDINNTRALCLPGVGLVPGLVLNFENRNPTASTAGLPAKFEISSHFAGLEQGGGQTEYCSDLQQSVHRQQANMIGGDG